MKIRNKFIVFAVVIGALATIGSLYLGFTNLKSVDGLFKSRQKEKEILFDNLNKLKSASLLSYAYDYSYWDDMVALAEKGNTTDFAKQNLDPSLTTYKANAVWVYNLNLNPVYSVNNLSEDKFKEFPLPVSNLRQAFANKLFPHFYVKTGSDIMEVAAAPIQPSADTERKTAAHGYFLVGRIWDQTYLKDFSALMGGKVERDDADPNQSFFPTDKQKGIVVFHRDLVGFDGNPVVGLHVEISTPEVGVLYQTTTFQLYYLTLISFFAVVVSLGILYLITIRPVNLISKSLDQADVKWLGKIQNSKDEFGQIARLIIKFFEQKTSLEKEVAERSRAEKELEKQAKILEEKDLVIQATLKGVEDQNQDLSKNKLALLNVLEDAKELQTKLESQTEELRKFQLAADSAYEHIIITDNKGVIIYANSGAARNTGYAVEEMLGKTTALWGGQMSKEYYKQLWHTLAAEKQSFIGEITNKRKSGEKYTAQINVSPILDGKGEIQFFVGLENDITKERDLSEHLRKEKESVELKVQERTKELQEEQGKLQASINSLNVGFVMTDINYNVVNINSTAKRILCISDFKAILRDPGNIGSNCSLEDIEDNLKGIVDIRHHINKCLNEKNIINIDDISFNNRILHFFLSPIALFREKLDIIGVVILVEDITEAKIMARSKDEFFSIASHELRTPLTAIRGNTALMRDYYFDKIRDKDLKIMISDIHDSSIRLIQIVNDFLDTSRLEQGRIEFHNQDFDLPTVIKEVIKELEPNLLNSKLYLKLKPANFPIPLVAADRDRVKQILINLIGNAIKFTEKGGITISLTPNAKVVKTSVADTGKGLTPESKNLLFRKFQQAEDNILTRDSTRGTGLGLYISKLLVEGMGGKIYLESSEENKGSIFGFELPAVTKTKLIGAKQKLNKGK